MKLLKQYKGIAAGYAGMLLLILAGCTTHRDEGVRHPEADASAIQTFSAGKPLRVTLSPGIVFSMRVDVDGLNEIEEDHIRLRQDGSAVLPMVGTVNLSGCSLMEASTRLEELYGRFYQDPPLVRLQFSVDDGAAPWGYVTVLGRVRKPGRVNLPPTRDLTVSGAIQGADGYDTSANLKAVRISRADPETGNRQMVVNLERIGENGEAAQDLWLRSGDVVFVPETIF
jgi:protein involved in polysaccharide export with SLBB domain